MKAKILTLLFIIGVGFLNGCNKDEEESFQTKTISGDWNWTASCGGFTGQCSYPERDNIKTIQITDDRFIQKINRQITIDETYQITKTQISETNFPYEKSYELQLGDGRIIGMTFIQNKDILYVGNSLLLDSYKRK
ncbi:hypothetical protein LCGC14_2246480 [marine sediment metagenome]|uniref:Lipocalin-like domain-containing protein n=2 Tax=root TaxID=1 RepID=A0A831VPN4_9FLAO|nr:hypothetical protein [Pricia antarctica]